MLIDMRNGLMAGGKLSAKSYVQDGLVAMWDGEWNAGPGKHDASATTWKDLTGNGYDAEQRVATGWMWTDNAYRGEAQSGQGFSVPTTFNGFFASHIASNTFEFCFRPEQLKRMSIFGQYLYGAGVNFEMYANSGFRAYYSASPDVYGNTQFADMKMHTVAASCDGSNAAVFRDAVRFNYSYNPAASVVTPNPFIIGGENSRSAMSILGYLYCVRVYSKALSIDEMAANYAVDKARFNLPDAT